MNRNINKQTNKQTWRIEIHTVKPFGIIFDSSLEWIHSLHRCCIIKIGTKNDSVSFGKFGH